MALLKYREYDKYVLQYLNGLTEPVHKSVIIDGVADILNMSEEDRTMLTPGKHYIAYNDRCDWSLAYIKQAELIENVGRGIYKITDFGREFLAANPDFDFKIMKDKTPFLKNQKNNNKKVTDEDDIEAGESEEVKRTTEDYYEGVEAEILIRLKSLGENSVDKGTKFEDICLDLLEKIGYGTKDRTGGAGDRGIDGTLTLDKFGFDKVGIQCKCYSNSNITDNEITKFYHGLKNVNGINRGIFITTTDFTPTAKKVIDETKDIKIILINGYKLAKLMREYQVGIEVTEVNYIYNIVI